MFERTSRSPHSFHIPVMGIGFTVDTPLRVAKYGISSTISLVDDVLIEQMRKFHCEQEGEPYKEIGPGAEDSRARRITEYLNLIGRIVHRQVQSLQASPFEPGTEITRYFEMLPDGALRDSYEEMLGTSGVEAKLRAQRRLRSLAVPGGIDVNIMAKVDRDRYRDGKKLPPEHADASAALRGYANSALESALVLSAGFNRRLYAYLANFQDFFPDSAGVLKKEVVLKVSDYRSAVIQGRFLAQRGIWVSEYRIESGLNCGGHAFATKGLLMGPILEEFRKKREELAASLYKLYAKALTAQDRTTVDSPPPVRITVQGGIGTSAEHEFLLRRYEVDGAGWATPFLLVPEVSNVDDEHLEKLSAAAGDDVYLSNSSPFGMPFWNLRNSASEEARRRRIAEGKPGSLCRKGFAKLFNTEFTDAPLCVASRAYQRTKLLHLPGEELSEEQLAEALEEVGAKSCICHDLGGGATLKNGIDPDATPAICPGPGIAYFSKIASLEEMIGHIYGRLSLITSPDRPHMFIRELLLYVENLRCEMKKLSLGLTPATSKSLLDYKMNLLEGIAHYRCLAEHFVHQKRGGFLEELNKLQETIEAISIGEVETSDMNALCPES